MSFSPSIYGSLTRKLFKVWNERAELPNKQLVRSLPYVFHDMDVYPSRSQIHEMIHCANHCSHRLNADYLTFGEFCVYASELKSSADYDDNNISHLQPLSKCDIPEHRKVTLSQQKESSKCLETKFEVFLGGSCNPTTWRVDTAIPILKSLGITYYNPQVSSWRPELIELEWNAKQNADVLLFVIDNQTRGIVAMIESAFICGSQRNLILVFNETPGAGTFIEGEPITESEYKDIKQGQSYLQDIVERHGIPIFDQLPVALACVHRILREGIRPQDLSREDNAMPVRNGHLPLGDKLIRLREVFDSLDNDNTGEISLSDLRLAFRIITGRELSNNNLRQIAVGKLDDEPMDCVDDDNNEFKTVNLDDLCINFEEFCCIVTEFKAQINENYKFSQQLARKLVYLVEPIQRLFDWVSKSFRGSIKPSSSSQQIPYDNQYRDIYLGGSCHTSTWREDIAIPLLKKNGLTYFSSQFNSWSGQRIIPIEAATIERSRVLLFYINNTSRGLSSMILAGHYVALGCNVVLCIEDLKDGCIIDGEKLTTAAIKDYNRGRAYLSDMTTRVGLPVFNDIKEAVECCVKKCISNNNNNNTTNFSYQ
ncbi:uncharacterized protein LOC128954945 isoform X2 [Oppia nitens]|nr:uncharacterized protein LOC128954945 isoform X2 [Oppia nitens]